MPDNLIESTPSAYTYPLLIKQLLHTPFAQAAQQEIVYQKKLRFTYRARIGRAQALRACRRASTCSDRMPRPALDYPFPQVPKIGEAVPVAPGVFWIHMP
jgi:hypothetical protein